MGGSANLMTTHLSNGLSSRSNANLSSSGNDSNRLRLKPTDSMRHRSSYKRKSQVQLVDVNAVIEEQKENNHSDDHHDPKEIDLSNNMSNNTEDILQLNFHETMAEPSASPSPAP